MEIKVWFKRGVILLLGIVLFGCATSEDAKILDERIFQLQIRLNAIQKEKDSLSKELTAFRKETRGDVSTLKTEDDLLRTALTTETKKLQDALSLRLENLQSQLNTIQKEKDSLSKELTAFRKETRGDVSTLKTEDDLLKTALTTETKKLQDALSLRLENLQYDIQILSTAVEEYKDFLQRTSKEMDRLREYVAANSKALDERGKTLEEKTRVQEDRVNASEDRIRGMEDRLKGLDEKIGQVVLKQMELEKSISAKEVSIGVKGLATGAGDLYRDAYETLQKGDLEGAQRKFEAFLKQYPNTELSDNAQFWIGETYYLKKDFEKAILEYEKAIVKYPEGDKIPAALLKQAFAFLEIGDKTNAKNLLRRVIERYPHSDQVDIAKKKLEGIK